MTMRTIDLLPALRKLPAGESGQPTSFREAITATDRTMFAAEFASAVSFGMWAVFNDRNVDDAQRETIRQAHERAFPGEDRAEWEHHRDALDDPETYDNTFMSPLKGAVAEINAKEQLNQRGWDVDLAPDSNQPGWDLHGTDPSGEYTQIQVKTGTSDSQYYDTIDAIRESEHPFLLGSELHDRISQNESELLGQVAGDIGPDYELVNETKDALATLSANMGIDLPDSAIDVLSSATEIAAGVLLIYEVVKTEREFTAIDRKEKNKVQVVQALTLLSRMGINRVLGTAVGSGGALAGIALPGPGTIVGAIVGTAGGVGIGMYLNKKLTGRLMMDLALNITGLTNDDLFYFKNKSKIDRLALSFQRTGSRAVEGAL